MQDITQFLQKIILIDVVLQLVRRKKRLNHRDHGAHSESLQKTADKDHNTKPYQLDFLLSVEDISDFGK